MDLREIKAGIYHRHPWEIARSSAILSMIPNGRYERIIDVGAGDLYFLERFIKRFPGKAFAVDNGYQQLGTAGGVVLLKTLEEIPSNSMDIGFMMDVLEHEERDGELLTKTVEKMKPAGLVIVTAPAYAALFSPHDRFLKHIRRYNRAQLLNLTTGNDVRIIKLFSFFTIPLFIRVLQIILSKFNLFRFTDHGVGGWTFAESHLLTKLASHLLLLDFLINQSLNRIGIPTLGLSLCMLLKKKSA